MASAAQVIANIAKTIERIHTFRLNELPISSWGAGSPACWPTPSSVSSIIKTNPNHQNAFYPIPRKI